MQRFFITRENIEADKAFITGKDQIHYIKNVLRCKAGKRVRVFDEKENEYSAEIIKINADMIILKIEKKEEKCLLKKPRLSVACAIPKKSKLDDIIDKLTQLGIDAIIPLVTQRTVVRPKNDRNELRQRRWEKIALNASQQSRRTKIPIVEEIKNLNELLKNSSIFDLKLIPTLEGKNKSIKEVLSENKDKKNILVLIGPEGDFSKEEVELAKKSGFIPISLGSLILRVETAAVAVASFIRFYENS